MNDYAVIINGVFKIVKRLFNKYSANPDNQRIEQAKRQKSGPERAIWQNVEIIMYIYGIGNLPEGSEGAGRPAAGTTLFGGNRQVGVAEWEKTQDLVGPGKNKKSSKKVKKVLDKAGRV